ncbi:MAG TPA: hypothetical protein VLE43_11605 [Candidatus Saccharimonadia bacterium]|nr:hypothetical protein [Candidatus Saccharimonadia bacterium]
MKATRLLSICGLGLLLATPVMAEPPKEVIMKVQVAEIVTDATADADADKDEDAVALEEAKLEEKLANPDALTTLGAAVVTAPVTKIALGKPATVSFTREFPLPSGAPGTVQNSKLVVEVNGPEKNKDRMDVSLLLSVRPTVYGERVQYSLDYDLSEFSGYAQQGQQWISYKGQDMKGATAFGKSTVMKLSKRAGTVTYAILTFTKG